MSAARDRCSHHRGGPRHRCRSPRCMGSPRGRSNTHGRCRRQDRSGPRHMEGRNDADTDSRHHRGHTQPGHRSRLYRCRPRRSDHPRRRSRARLRDTRRRAPPYTRGRPGTTRRRGTDSPLHRACRGCRCWRHIDHEGRHLRHIRSRVCLRDTLGLQCRWCRSCWCHRRAACRPCAVSRRLRRPRRRLRRMTSPRLSPGVRRLGAWASQKTVKSV